MKDTVFTIGHSTHSADELVSMLALHRVTAIADVRSHPYSRFNPQFNREPLDAVLQGAGIDYVFLGRELGARSEDPSCYVDGKVQYDRLAQSAHFQAGLDRIERGISRRRIALMCAEKDPLTCHRTILVSRHLVARGIEVTHILADGSLESHIDALNRLLIELHLPERDLFRTREEIIAEAYRIRGEEIAYKENESTVENKVHGVHS